MNDKKDKTASDKFSQLAAAAENERLIEQFGLLAKIHMRRIGLRTLRKSIAKAIETYAERLDELKNWEEQAEL